MLRLQSPGFSRVAGYFELYPKVFQDPRIPGLNVHVFTSSWIRMDQDGSGTGARNIKIDNMRRAEMTQSRGICCPVDPVSRRGEWPLSSDVCASSLSREKTACNAKMAALFPRNIA